MISITDQLREDRRQIDDCKSVAFYPNTDLGKATAAHCRILGRGCCRHRCRIESRRGRLNVTQFAALYGPNHSELRLLEPDHRASDRLRQCTEGAATASGG